MGALIAFVSVSAALMEIMAFNMSNPIASAVTASAAMSFAFIAGMMCDDV